MILGMIALNPYLITGMITTTLPLLIPGLNTIHPKQALGRNIITLNLNHGKKHIMFPPILGQKPTILPLNYGKRIIPLNLNPLLLFFTQKSLTSLLILSQNPNPHPLNQAPSMPTFL
uniref:Uncharacterized protein n=1 Tax=Cacopsylla melanoneura TaxID=428564 RepID=A0A8D8TWB3_9HEMI